MNDTSHKPSFGLAWLGLVDPLAYFKVNSNVKDKYSALSFACLLACTTAHCVLQHDLFVCGGLGQAKTAENREISECLHEWLEEMSPLSSSHSSIRLFINTIAGRPILSDCFFFRLLNSAQLSSTQLSSLISHLPAHVYQSLLVRESVSACLCACFAIDRLKFTKNHPSIDRSIDRRPIINNQFGSFTSSIIPIAQIRRQ